MTLPEETRMHLLGGLIVAVALVVLIELGRRTHPALAVAIAGPLFAWGVERYQAIRRAGTPEKRDLIATAAPFELVAAALWWLA
jgi:hypothetical protein